MALIRSAAIIALINPTVAPVAGTVDFDFDKALLEGVDPIASPPTPDVPPFGGYDTFSPEIKAAVRQSYAGLLAAIAPGPWTPGAMGGTWTAKDPGAGGIQDPEYRREGFDLVRLRGSVTRPSGVVTTIMTLPDGFKPPADLSFCQRNGTSTEPAFINILASGIVEFESGNVAFISLDGIVFSTSA